MIWATLSSWFCFCQLYTVSSSSAAKNIINLILILAIWWCPCVESSLVVGRGCLLYQWVLLAKFCCPLPCFILYSKAKLACYSSYLLTSYNCIPVPSDEKDIFFLVLVGEYRGPKFVTLQDVSLVCGLLQSRPKRLRKIIDLSPNCLRSLDKVPIPEKEFSE